MPFKLKKDIVIPAGTVFHCIDNETRNYLEGNYSHLFGLTPETSGEIIYGIDDKIPEWFEEVE